MVPVGPVIGDTCLSVQQPWAASIIHGMKTVENRSRPTKYRGRLFVHASKTLAFRSWRDVFDVPLGPTGAVEILASGIVLPSPPDLPRSAIVGSVEVYDCCHFDDLPEDCDVFGFANPGSFCYLLRDPQPLPEPIPARGALGLWKWRG